MNDLQVLDCLDGSLVGQKDLLWHQIRGACYAPKEKSIPLWERVLFGLNLLRPIWGHEQIRYAYKGREIGEFCIAHLRDLIADLPQKATRQRHELTALLSGYEQTTQLYRLDERRHLGY